MTEVARADIGLYPSVDGRFGSQMTGQLGSQIGRSGKTLGSSFGKLFAAASGLAIGAKALSVLKDSTAEAREAQKVGAATLQIIKQTGFAAGVSAEHVGKLSSAISKKAGIDDEAIQKGANLILTFKNVANQGEGTAAIFDRATQAAVDLSATGFGSIEGGAKMLGKALNDPIAGISALSRAGVTFTQGQKDTIASLVESGDVLKAQKIILKEVESQVGGVAAATATAGDKAKVAWGNVKETIGTALLPVIDKFSSFFTSTLAPAMESAVPKVQALFGSISGFITPIVKQLYGLFLPGLQALGPAFQTLLGFVTPLVVQLRDFLAPVFERIGTFLQQNPVFVKAFVIALAALVVGITAVTVATSLFSLALQTTGIPIVVIAIAALVAGLVLAYQKSETFRSIVQQVGEVLKQVGVVLVEFGGWIKTNVLPAVAQFAQTVAGNLKPILTQLGETFQNQILPAIQRLIAKFREWGPTIAQVAGFVGRLIAKWYDFVTTIMGKVWPVIIKLAGWLVGTGVSAWIKYVEGIAKVIGKLIDFGKKVVDAAQKVGEFAKTVGRKIDQVISFFTGLAMDIRQVIDSLVSDMLQKGRDLVGNLVSGIKEKIGDAVDAVKGLASDIGGLFHGSPVKYGPLLSWNNGGAGKRLVASLVEGITAARPQLVQTMVDTVDSLANKTDEQLGKMQDRIKSRLSKIGDAFSSLKDSVSSAFTPDLFGAASLDEFFDTGRGNGVVLSKLLAALKKLKKIPGLKPGFIASLFQSGNTALILELASSDANTALEAQGVFQQNNNLANQLGTDVAQATYGPQLKSLERELREIRKAVQQSSKDIVDGINGSVADGHKRRHAA